MKGLWHKKELATDIFHRVNYLILLIIPLILGIVLYFGTYLVMKNQIDTAGVYKARHFKTEMEQMFQEISIISASLVSDSAVARMLYENEVTEYPLSLCTNLGFYESRSDYINTIYVIDTGTTIISSKGRYTRNSLPMLLSRIGETEDSFRNEISTKGKGWHISGKEIIEPYYTDFIIDETGNKLADIVIVINTVSIHRLLTYDDVAFCGLYNENGYISSQGAGRNPVDWNDPKAIAEYLSQNVMCFYADSEDFHYIVAVSTDSYRAPLNIILLLFALYFLVLIVFWIVHLIYAARKNKKNLERLIRILPKDMKGNPTYEEYFTEIEKTLSNYRDYEQFYRFERQSGHLRYILGGYTISSWSDKFLENSGILIECNGYHVISLYLDDDSGIIFDEEEKTESRNISLLILKTAFSSTPEQSAVVSVCRIDGNFSLVISHRTEDQEGEEAERILSAGMRYLEDNYDMHIQAVISGWVEKPELLSNAYAGTKDTYELACVLDINKDIIFTEKIGVSNHSNMQTGWLHGIQTLVSSLLLKKYSLAEEIVYSLIDDSIISIKRDPQFYRKRISCLTEILIDGIITSSDESDRYPEYIAALKDISSDMELRKTVGIIFEELRGTDTAQMGYVERACSYIRAHISNISLSVTVICEETEVSVQHLSRLFKKQLNKTITEYINECRIDLAKTLIAQGGKSMSEISELIGYGSSDSFYRNFKKMEQITPAEYAKLISR